MSDEATCARCGGRITFEHGKYAHNWLDPGPPPPDLRVPPHEPWPYLHAHQGWRNGRRDSERPRALAWDTPAFQAAHPGSRRDRALAWLRATFGHAR